jgi:uncharacterized membrane protein YqgA involved in biofilm formation
MHTDAIVVILTVVGAQLGAVFYLNSRIDRIGDKLDKINEMLGDHGARLKTLEGAPGKAILR